jgi:hypothetical protein
MSDITDGVSNTYLIGERYVNPDHCTDGSESDDDQGWIQGYDYDTNRWVQIGDKSDPDTYLWPMRDTPGVSDVHRFGSAHPTGLLMALCDGTVPAISYSIDVETHRRLGNRQDGLPVDAKRL